MNFARLTLQELAEIPVEFPLLTTVEVGEMLGGLNIQTVRRLAREGVLPSMKPGRDHVFNRRAIEAVVQKTQTVGPGA